MFNTYYSKYRSWRRNRQAYSELMEFSSRQLADIGIRNRQDIKSVVYPSDRSLSSVNSG
ncbi:MAG: DUF1127 domain-containing protein [Hyphomicrobiales bacterium]|nr:DUF1127 domain-containing protein [Hyphomicrobiales bacterium]